MDERIERQELYCHACGRYVQFPMDLSLNGRHVLNCPNCGHEHCRVVKDGVITDERWAQRNGNIQTYQISPQVVTATTATMSSAPNSTDDSWRIYGSWGTATMNTSIYLWTDGA